METTFNIGDIVEAEVTRITDFGAFAKINGRGLGLIHISQISDSFVKDVREHLKIGDKVKARVIKLGPGKKIDLTLKRPASRLPKKDSGPACRQAGFKSSDFEEKLKKLFTVKDS
ncbi:MAG: S1 RNA-binding domain-containing protein [Candidatus Omnitrophica bacterium]|nr:S1 RNA-binding domain-containing protein [Candidatus Omnitrophota bacterium]